MSAIRRFWTPSTLRRDLRVCERTGELLEAFYPQTAPVPFLDRQTSRNLKCIQRRRSTTATARLKAVTPASPGSGERDSGSARRPRSNQICPLSGAKRTCSGRKRIFPFPMSAFGGKADVIVQPSECPLIARSGHSRLTAGRFSPPKSWYQYRRASIQSPPFNRPLRRLRRSPKCSAR